MAKTLAELRIPETVLFPDPYTAGFDTTEPLNLPWGPAANLRVNANNTWGRLTGYSDRYMPNVPGRTGWTMTMWLRGNWNSQSPGDVPVISTVIPSTTSLYTYGWQFRNGSAANTVYFGPSTAVSNISLPSLVTTTWVFCGFKLDTFSNTTGASGTCKTSASFNGQPWTAQQQSVAMPAYNTTYELHFFGLKNNLNVYQFWNPTAASGTPNIRMAKLMFWPRALTDTEMANLWMASQGILYTP